MPASEIAIIFFCALLGALAVIAVLRRSSGGAPVTPPAMLAPGTNAVVLLDAGPNKIALIRAVRAMTGLGLSAAKAFVEQPNATLPNLSDDAAQRVKSSLEAAGAKVELVGNVPAGSDGDLATMLVTDCGPNKIAAIKAVRQVTDLDLADAIAVVEGRRTLSFPTPETAASAAVAIEQTGAKTDIVI